MMQRMLVKRTQGTLTQIRMGGHQQPPPIHSLWTARRNLSSNGNSFRATSLTPLPMKPGTVLPGLDLYKEKEPPVVLERSEYPEWVADLAKPPLTLAELRRIPEEEATDRDIMRFVKLERKIEIKKTNQALKGQRRRKRR